MSQDSISSLHFVDEHFIKRVKHEKHLLAKSGRGVCSNWDKFMSPVSVDWKSNKEGAFQSDREETSKRGNQY